MNLYRPTARSTKDGPAIQALVDNKFEQIAALENVDTNASQTEAYDRMFFRVSELFKIAKDDLGNEKGGVFNIFDHVYEQDQHNTYKRFMLKDYGGSKDLDNNIDELKKYYINTWRKNQISDHFPIWVEIVIDSSDEFLQMKKEAFEQNI